MEAKTWAKTLEFMARIRVKNLLIRTYIGFNPQELVNKQDVIINLDIETDIPDHALEADEPLDIFDYKTITKKIIALVQDGKFKLLEVLTKNILDLIMADESVLDQPDMDVLQKQFGGINMKLMKAGGYINGLRIISEAKRRNLKTMIGCMVETSLGINSAWSLAAETDYADLDGYLVVSNEPFGLLKEEEGMVYESGLLPQFSQIA